jgi:cytochrome c-type biogenesis protein CcmH/NrfG
MPAKAKSQVRRRKPNPRKNKTFLTFNVIVVIVVAALVFGATGAAVVNELVNNAKKDDTINVSPDQVDEIEQGYREAVTKDSTNVDAIVALASYLGNTGNTEEAIQWYQKALELTPDDTSLRLSFASTLVSGGKDNDAELQYQKVITAEPNNGLALLGLARLYRSWSPPRNDDAAAYYQLTIDRAGDSVAKDLAEQELAALTGTPDASPAASPEASPASP